MTTNEVEELKRQGNAAFASGSFKEAIVKFEEAIRADPNNHVLYSNRSAAYASLKDWSRALEDAEKTIQLQPDWSKGYGRKGAALLGLGNAEEALQAYQRGLELEPENAQLKQGIQMAQQQLQSTKQQPRSFDNPFSDPNLIAKLAGNPKTASLLAQPDFVAKLQEMQRDPKAMGKYLNDPRFMQVLSVLLGINVSMSSKDEANDEEEKATSETEPTKPSSPESQTLKPSSPESKANEPPCAPKVDPTKVQVQSLKEQGNSAYKNRHFDDALKHYDSALELSPTNVPIRINKAAVYFETERYQECIDLCEEAVELGREQHVDFKLLARALSRIGASYHKMDKLDLAIKYYQKSLAEHRTAETLAKIGQLERESKERAKAAYHDPKIAEEERNLGNDLFRSGQYVEALKHYSESIRRDENDPRGYANRAACYLKLAAVPEGLADCNRCLAIDPTFIKAYIRKAGLEMLKRDFTTALATCQTALSHDTDGKHRNEIQQMILRCYAESSGSDAADDGSADQSEEAILKRAMADPEVAAILGDPVMRQILKQMESDPAAAAEHMRNPVVAGKIRKLIAAKVIRTGGHH